jgi:hypothetical protein
MLRELLDDAEADDPMVLRKVAAAVADGDLDR